MGAGQKVGEIPEGIDPNEIYRPGEELPEWTEEDEQKLREEFQKEMKG